MKYIYKDMEYDREKNPEGRSVAELAAIGIEWEYDGVKYTRIFSDSGSACELKILEGIAIVDIDIYGSGIGYIIDMKGNTIFSLERYFHKNKINYYDVYYTKKLTFIAMIDGYDAHLTFDENRKELIGVNYVRV